MRSLGRAASAGDDGFGLVETVIALAVLAAVMAALLAAMMVGIRGVDLARGNQQAGALANAELENLRTLPYNQVLLRTGDPTLPAGSYAGEALDVAPAGAVVPHRRDVASDTRTYTVRRWVTQASFDAAGSVATRRVTVEVSWTQHGKTHRRLVSSLMTNTRRGLPLPQFTWRCNGSGCSGPSAAITRGPGSDASFGFSLRNLGARDTWNLSASKPGWTFYRDTDKDGLWSGSISSEPPLTDTDGDGVVDTAPIEPSTQPQFFVAHRIAGAGESGTSTIDFVAASSASPADGTKVVPATLTVTASGAIPSPPPTPGPTPAPTTCTSGSPIIVAGPSIAPTIPNKYSPLTLMLFNGPPDGDTPRLAANAMGTDTSTQAAVCNYAVDVQTGLAGRQTTPLSPAVWSFQPPSTAVDEFRGTAVAKVWIACDAGVTPTVTVRLMSGSAASTQRAASSLTLSADSCDGRYFGVPFDLPLQTSGFGVTHGSADRLTLRLETTGPLRLLYDAPGAGATLVVGTK